ncbi:MAG: rod shape-determining protein MreC, partial [Lachnospiraceae bacterium]|nr:rod shape-determining protein MreC [Lachnospiraceae bacterium]
QEYELEWYRYLYENDSVYQNAEKVAARIISRNPNGACDMFVIDKGEEDGIEVDMNVLAGGGLVGIITDVGSNWAKVRTIIADDSSVSGRFQPTSDTCIVKGNMRRMDDGYIDVEMINLNAEVYDNYEVLTSYISDKYLPGILIGYVTNIRKDPSELNKRAYLTPVVDFEHLEAVLIVKTLRENLEGFE